MNKSRSIFDKLVHFIVFKGKIIESIFFAATVICAACFPFVKVNYDLSKYLPQFAQTKQALDVMEDEFGLSWYGADHGAGCKSAGSGADQNADFGSGGRGCGGRT